MAYSASTLRRHEVNKRLVERWTAPIGSSVLVDRANGMSLRTVTESEAFLLDGKYAMIRVKGIPGNTNLRRVRLVTGRAR